MAERQSVTKICTPGNAERWRGEKWIKNPSLLELRIFHSLRYFYNNKQQREITVKETVHPTTQNTHWFFFSSSFDLVVIFGVEIFFANSFVRLPSRTLDLKLSYHVKQACRHKLQCYYSHTYLHVLHSTLACGFYLIYINVLLAGPIGNTHAHKQIKKEKKKRGKKLKTCLPLLLFP